MFAKILVLFLFPTTNEFCYSHMANLVGVHTVQHKKWLQRKEQYC